MSQDGLTWSRCPRLLRRRVLSPALRDRAPVAVHDAEGRPDPPERARASRAGGRAGPARLPGAVTAAGWVICRLSFAPYPAGDSGETMTPTSSRRVTPWHGR